MWFKNLQIYHLERNWSLAPTALEEILCRQPLQACPSMALHSHGWVPPGPSPSLVQGLDRQLLIALGSEEKLLPASVVNDAAADLAEAWSRSHGMKPGRKMMREFKERATSELLPRAFVRRRNTRAWIDPAHRRLVVDAASPTRAEALSESLREALGGLEITLPQPAHAPAELMTNWIRTETAPGRFTLGEECELAGADGAKPLIRYVRVPLLANQLNRHFDEGFRVSRLALLWNNRISLVADDRLQIKRVRFTDLEEAADEPAALPPEQRFEAEFALMTGDYARMIDDLMEAFGATAAAA